MPEACVLVILKVLTTVYTLSLATVAHVAASRRIHLSYMSKLTWLFSNRIEHWFTAEDYNEFYLLQSRGTACIPWRCAFTYNDNNVTKTYKDNDQANEIE